MELKTTKEESEFSRNLGTSSFHLGPKLENNHVEFADERNCLVLV